MTTKIKNTIKMETTLEQSHKIQKICFDNDVEWITSEKELQDYTLINICDSYLYRNATKSIFDSLEFEQIDPELFIRTNGTCVEEEIKTNKEEEEIVTTKIKTGIKLKVTPEQSLYVQNICFANGIYWTDDGKKLYFPEEAVYYINIRQEYMTWNEIDWIYYKDSELEEVDAMLFIRTNGTCAEEEIKTNKEDEESEMVTEEKVYKNAKEYLVDICVYEKVIHNCLNVSPAVDDLDNMNTFSSLFTWNGTVEGMDFWDDINDEIVRLELWKKIDEILEDVTLAKASANTIPTLKPEDIPLLMEGLEPPKETLEQPKQYLVYVEGKQPPKKVHNSLKSAQKEANRLAKKEVGYVTYVVEVVNKYKGTVSVEEIK